MAVSIVEYWNGSVWVQANTNAGSSATTRVDIIDKLGNPRVANITVLNPSANPFGSGADTYGPLTGIFTDFTPVRVIETDSKVVLFAGKVYSSKQEYDLGMGQVIKIYARDNLAEIADMPTDDKIKLIVSNATLNLKSEIIQTIIRDSAADPHSSSLMISASNVGISDTQKFEASARVLHDDSAPFPEFDVASMGKQGLKVIAEIAQNDAHEASGPAKDFGYDYYVDSKYTFGVDGSTITDNSNPAADFNYFKRGTRTTFEGTASNFKGLTVEYPVTDFTRTGIKVPMLTGYDFNQPPSDLYTGAVVALTSDLKDVDDATPTTNTSLEVEILEGTLSAAFIHADPTISTSAWEGKLFARVGDGDTAAKEFADYLWKVGDRTSAGSSAALNTSGGTLAVDATSVIVDTGHGFKAGDIMTIDVGEGDEENVYITEVGNPDTTLTVIRGWGSTAATHDDNSTLHKQNIVGRIQYQSTNSGAGYILISFERDTVSSTTLNTQKKEFERVAASSEIVLTNGTQTFTFTPSTGRPKIKYGLNKPLRITGNDIKSLDATRSRIASGLSRTKSSRTECLVNTLPPPFTYLATGVASITSSTVVVLDDNSYLYGARIGMTIAKVNSAGVVTSYGYITAISGATVTASLKIATTADGTVGNTGTWTGYSGDIRVYIPVRAGHYIRANNVLVNFEGYMLTQEITYTEQAGAQVTSYKGTGINSAGLPIGLGIDPNAIVAAIEGESRKYPRITNVPMGGLGWTFRPTDTTNTATFTGTDRTTMTWTGGQFTIGQMKKYKVRSGSTTFITTVDSNTTYPKVYKVLFDPDQAPDDNGTFTFTFTLEEDYKPDMDHVIMGHARAGSTADINAMIIFDGSGLGFFGGRDAVGEDAFSAALFKKTVQPYTTDVIISAGQSDGSNKHRYASSTAGTISFADDTVVTVEANTSIDSVPSSGSEADNRVFYIFFKLVKSDNSETDDYTLVANAEVDRTLVYSEATSKSRGLLAICSTGDISETTEEISVQAFHGKGQNITADVIAANAIVADAIKAGSISTAKISGTLAGNVLSIDANTTFSSSAYNPSIATALANTAQGTANTAVTNAATAQTEAESKAKVTRSDSEPSSDLATGDIWYKTASPYSSTSPGVYIYTGSAWQLRDDVAAINLASTTINGGLINTQRIKLLKGGGNAATVLDTNLGTTVTSTLRLIDDSGGISSSDTTIGIDAHAGSDLRIYAGDVIQIPKTAGGTEDMYVLKGSDTSIEVIRAWNSTTAGACSDNALISKYNTPVTGLTDPHVIMDNYGIVGYSDAFTPQFSLSSEDGKGVFGAGTGVIDSTGMVITGSTSNQKISLQENGQLIIGDGTNGGSLLDKTGLVVVGTASTSGIVKVGGGGAATGRVQFWAGGANPTSYTDEDNLIVNMYGVLGTATTPSGSSPSSYPTGILYIELGGDGTNANYPGELILGLGYPWLDSGVSESVNSVRPGRFTKAPAALNGTLARGNGWLGNDAGSWSGLYLSAQDGSETLADMQSATVATSKAPGDLTNEADNVVIYAQRSATTNGHLQLRARYNGGTAGTALVTKHIISVDSIDIDNSNSATDHGWGTAGQVVQSDGDGTFSWATNGGGGGSGDITGVTLAGDSGTAEDLTANVNLTIAGGTNVTTSGSGSTLTINATDTNTVYTHPDPIRLGDGSAAAPTYSFTNDTNMGLFREGSNIYTFASNGQAHVAIDGNSGRASLRLDDYVGSSTPDVDDYPPLFFGTDRDTGMRYYADGAIAFLSNSVIKVVTGYSASWGLFASSIVTTGAVSKASGSFRIKHPLDETNKTLVHGFVEAPRHDLIYRGTATLSSGTATVSIDTASSMTSGTFAALTKNPEIWIQNKTGWTAVKGQVSGGNVVITAQDSACTDTIAWLVMAERNDTFIKSEKEPWTDGSGTFIPEWDNGDLDPLPS